MPACQRDSYGAEAESITMNHCAVEREIVRTVAWKISQYNIILTLRPCSSRNPAVSRTYLLKRMTKELRLIQFLRYVAIVSDHLFESFESWGYRNQDSPASPLRQRSISTYTTSSVGIKARFMVVLGLFSASPSLNKLGVTVSSNTAPLRVSDILSPLFLITEQPTRSCGSWCRGHASIP